MAYGSRQQQVRAYRGQVPSPGRPTVAWREDRVRFWAAIARGVKTEDAAAEAGVSSPLAFRWFRHAGGVNPGLPAAVSGRYLSFGEREDIAIWRAQDVGVREIARRLGRSPSTISRELRRNASTRTYRLYYKASIAQWHAERRARRPKVAKLVANDRLRRYVQDRLSGGIRTDDGQDVGPAGPKWQGRNKPHRADRRWVRAWSPEQIANRLPFQFPDDKSMRISHEAIYQALYVQARGALSRELVACLRTGRALRVPRARARQRAWGACHTGGIDQRTSRRGRRPRVARPLGGRSNHRVTAVRDRHPGRAHHPVHDAGPSAARGWLERDPPGEERTCSGRLMRSTVPSAVHRPK
jgi:hypothetical protein